jgi:small subunit ribosomal protein S4e
MGNNQHLKRHSAPVAWPVKRKNITFIAKPNAGSHKSRYVVPVVVLLRDVLKYAETAKEVKLIVHNQDVLVNGRKTIDVKSPVGLFDVFEIKNTNEKYLVLFDELGKLKLVETKDSFMYLKVKDKKQVSGGKYQLNFMNGYNLLVDEKTFKGIKVNDTLVYDFDKKKQSGVLNLKEGSFVYIFDGKFKGKFGEIKSFEHHNGLTEDIAQIQINGEVHSTAKDYCFVVGAKKEDLKKFE